MTAPIKTNRILALHTLKETDDDVEFATDMEEPVCEGSEEHNHQQERYPHRIMDVYFGLLKISTRDYCRLDNSLKLILDVVSNTEQLWRSFRVLTAGKKVGLTNYSNHSVMITCKLRDKCNCVGVAVLKSMRISVVMDFKGLKFFLLHATGLLAEIHTAHWVTE